MDLSVLILAKNEEKNIKECIESVSFAEEIIVIDDFSVDNTKKIAEEMGAKVYQRSMSGDWGAQQTYAIEKASKKWIFFIDADERVTPELAQEIKETVKADKNYGYWIKRINHFNYELVNYGPLSPDYVCRLMPKEGSYVEGFVHPKIVHKFTDRKMKSNMIHYTYNNWEQYINKMNQYSSLAAEKNFKNRKTMNFILDIILRPLFAFFKMYILKKGFLDGKIGYMLSANYANYTMNKYIKLGYLQEKRKSCYKE